MIVNKAWTDVVFCLLEKSDLVKCYTGLIDNNYGGCDNSKVVHNTSFAKSNFKFIFNLEISTASWELYREDDFLSASLLSERSASIFSILVAFWALWFKLCLY